MADMVRSDKYPFSIDNTDSCIIVYHTQIKLDSYCVTMAKKVITVIDIFCGTGGLFIGIISYQLFLSSSHINGNE